MSPLDPRRHLAAGLWLAAGAALVAAKLWLVADLPIWAVGPNYVDQSAFAQLGLNLAQGQGLGPYQDYTLIKGPGYPLFIALAWKLGARLLLAQHVLYAAACAALCIAARGVAPAPGVRLALFALLLWNPITWQPHLLRPMREGIYPAQTLLCIAAALALANARAGPIRRLALAALALGGALAWLWITREEGIWVLPALAIAAAALAIDLLRRRPPDALARLACYALVAVVPFATSTALALHNQAVYGVPAVIELRTREFQAACGALQRAIVDPPHRLLALPRATRERLYAVSPSFAELRSGFEGRNEWRWVVASTHNIPELAKYGEIAGGWWLWAVRAAASEHGWHATGAGALARYDALAKEVNAACDDGRLSCGPPRASCAPSLHLADLAPAAVSTWRAAAFVVLMEGAVAGTPDSHASLEELDLFRRATHTRTSGLTDARRRYPALEAVVAVYVLLTPLLSGAALALLAWRARSLPVSAAVTLAALAALFVARIVLIGVIHATSFPALNPLHLAPAYPVWLAFCGLAIASAVRGRAPISRPAAPP